MFTYPTYVDYEVAGDFLAERLRVLQNDEDFGGIVLIGHSMGGLVARQAAGDLEDDPAYEGLTRGIITLGTPHLGTPLATARLFADWFEWAVETPGIQSLSLDNQRIDREEVPIYAYGGNIRNKSSRGITYGLSWSMMCQARVEWCDSDGFVPLQSAVPDFISLDHQRPDFTYDHTELHEGANNNGDPEDELYEQLVADIRMLGRQQPLPDTWIGEQVDYISGAGVSNVWIADADNDGQNEILVSTHGGLVFLYELDGGMWTRQTIASLPSKRASIKDVGDADNDGKLEVLVDFNVDPVYANTLAELRLYEFESGTWGFQVLVGGTSGSYGGAIGDADGDGENEVVVTGYNLHQILLLEHVSGSFVQTSIDATSEATAIASIGDAMNLGTPQVYIGTHTRGDIFSYQWSGSTWIKNAVEESTGYIALPFNGDADNDGINDLIVSKYAGSWGLSHYQYTGSTWFRTVIELADRESTSIADLDGDGLVEVMTPSGQTVYAYQYRAGSGWTRSQLFPDVGFDISLHDVGDAIGNGRQAIVVGKSGGPNVWLFTQQ